MKMKGNEMLDGVVVVEFGRIFSAPLAGMILSDLGARVIKIERKGAGDESRRYGMMLNEGFSDYYFALNRKKEVLQLDLKDGADLATVRDMLRDSDVLIHNSLQASFDGLGLSYNSVRELNPKIIYAAISGYGSESKYRDFPSQDVTVQGLSGLMSLSGFPDNIPLKTGVPVVDFVTGQYLVIGIMAALRERGQTGEGRLVTASLLESAASMTSIEAVRYLNNNVAAFRCGNRHHSIAPYNSFEAIDGHVMIAIANDEMFGRFALILGIDTEGFETNSQRLRDIDRLEDIIGEQTKKYTAAKLASMLKGGKVSCEPINDIAQALESEEFRELNLVGRENGLAYIKTPINFL